MEVDGVVDDAALGGQPPGDRRVDAAREQQHRPPRGANGQPARPRADVAEHERHLAADLDADGEGRGGQIDGQTGGSGNAAPASHAISYEVAGKRLSERRASTLNARTRAGSRARAARACVTAASTMTGSSGATARAGDSETSPKTRVRRAQASSSPASGTVTRTRPCGALT